jgi:hypothetical protein
VHLASHLITDSFDGEAPSVPACVVSLSKAEHQAGTPDTVLALTGAVFQLLTVQSQTLQAQRQQQWSPALADVRLMSF